MFGPVQYFPWTYRCSDWELWTNRRTELCLRRIQSDNYCHVRKKPQQCPCRFVLESQVPLCCNSLSHPLVCIWLLMEIIFQKSVRKMSISGSFTEVRNVRNHGSSWRRNSGKPYSNLCPWCILLVPYRVMRAFHMKCFIILSFCPSVF